MHFYWPKKFCNIHFRLASIGFILWRNKRKSKKDKKKFSFFSRKTEIYQFLTECHIAGAWGCFHNTLSYQFHYRFQLGWFSIINNLIIIYYNIIIISGQSTVKFDSLCSGPLSGTCLNQKTLNLFYNLRMGPLS